MIKKDLATSKTTRDPKTKRKLVGGRLRELIKGSGITTRQLIDLMNESGHYWNDDIASTILTGRRRNLHLDEVVTLASILNVTTDAILVEALGAPETPQQRTPEPPTINNHNITKIHNKPDWRSPTDHVPGFNAGPGQLAELNALAARAGTKRAALLREFIAIMIPAYTHWLDNQEAPN